MPAYDDRLYSPAAPVCSAKLRADRAGATQADVLMLMDSGADVTLLPKSIIESLGIELSGASFELIGFDGTASRSETVHAELVVFGKTYRGQFLVINQDIGVLGRNVLNHVCLLLDGPHLTWEERPSAKDI